MISSIQWVNGNIMRYHGTMNMNFIHYISTSPVKPWVSPVTSSSQSSQVRPASPAPRSTALRSAARRCWRRCGEHFSGLVDEVRGRAGGSGLGSGSSKNGENHRKNVKTRENWRKWWRTSRFKGICHHFWTPSWGKKEDFIDEWWIMEWWLATMGILFVLLWTIGMYPSESGGFVLLFFCSCDFSNENVDITNEAI